MTLQDLIDSAKLCGLKPEVLELQLGDPNRMTVPRTYVSISEAGEEWYPREDGNQQNEIRDALRERGYSILIASSVKGANIYRPEHQLLEVDANHLMQAVFKADADRVPANDFLILAGAHVWRLENE